MTLYTWLIGAIVLTVVASEDVALFRKTNATEVTDKLCRIIENIITGKSPNDIVDVVLELIKYNLIRLGKDSVELPDATNKFEWKTTLIYPDDNSTDHFSSEELSFKNGLLLDLSDLERYEDANLTEQEEDIVVDASFRYKNLVFDYQYHTKYRILGPREYLTGIISSTIFTVQLRVTSDGMVVLEECKFNELGNLSLVWNKTSSTVSIYETFSIISKPFLKPILIDTLSRYVEETLKELIKEYNSDIGY